MLHEGTVKFHTTKYFTYTRTQDAQQYELQKQYDLFIMIDQHYINLLVNYQNPLCKIYIKILDLKRQKHHQHNNKNKSHHLHQLTAYFVPPANQYGERQHIPLVTIKSSKLTISQIKQAIDQNSKYKSCMSFIPSKVKHISILSGQSPTQRFRGFINLAAVMFMILNIRSIIDNFISYGIIFGHTPFQYIPINFIIALILLGIFPTIAYLIQKLKYKRYISPTISKLLNVINLLSILIFTTFYCILFKPSPLLAILYTALSIITLLKLISYYQVNTQLYILLQRIKRKKKSQKQIQLQIFTHYQISQDNLDYIIQFKDHQELLINFQQLLYFIFIPTLCFQLSYPKTSSIRVIWLGKRIVEFMVMVGFQIILWFQYIQPELKEQLISVHNPDSTWYQLFNRHLRLSIPNTIMWITGFYVFFHLWLNIIGQILYFGDRNFYRDWWNCRSLQQYWKTWNLPVHFWFIRHVYNPLLQLGVSKILANLIVFFVSALAHQYIVSVPLGFISYWAFLAIMMQAPAIFIQRKLDKILGIQHSQLSNAMFWVFFCVIGQPLVVFIYYAIYTDMINNDKTFNIPTFIPIDVKKIQL